VQRGEGELVEGDGSEVGGGREKGGKMIEQDRGVEEKE